MSGQAGQGDGSAGAPNGDYCGGGAALACGAGQFCDYAPDGQCGAGDAMGTCRLQPEGCTQNEALVCGCDGKTYTNACSANAMGVSVASDGACGTPSGSCGGIAGTLCPAGQFCNFPITAQCGSGDALGTCSDTAIACVAPDGTSSQVCGCDGNTYADACHAQQLGISVASEGACPNPVACGGAIDQLCPSGLFCNFPIDAQCGTSGQSGTCAPTNVTCPPGEPAVCGCDGRTYVGPCGAQQAGVAVRNKGTCTTQ